MLSPYYSDRLNSTTHTLAIRAHSPSLLLSFSLSLPRYQCIVCIWIKTTGDTIATTNRTEKEEHRAKKSEENWIYNLNGTYILIFKCLKTKRNENVVTTPSARHQTVLFSTIRHLCLSFGYIHTWCSLPLSLSLRFFRFLKQLDLKYNLENSTIKYFLEMSKTTDATHNKPKRQKKTHTHNTQMQQNYNILLVCSAHAHRTNIRLNTKYFNFSIFRMFG